LIIYNTLGQKIKTLLDQQLSSDSYTVRWDATNDAGVGVAAGIYFYRLKANHQVQTRKMVLLDGASGGQPGNTVHPQIWSTSLDESDDLQVIIRASSPAIAPYEKKQVKVTSKNVQVDIAAQRLISFLNIDNIVISEPSADGKVYVSGLAGAVMDSITSITDIKMVTVTNLRTGEKSSGQVNNVGGFGPITLEATIGDQLEASLTCGLESLGAPLYSRVMLLMPPKVRLSKPTDGDKDIVIDIQIKVYFSEPVQQSTVNINSFALTDSLGNIIPGSIGFLENNTVVTFDPANPLANNSTYTINVTTDVEDLQGLHLEGTYIAAFTTASEHNRCTVINIPADVDSIQGGIDLANDRDTVLVAPGTYVENINFKGKNIVVGSLFLTTGDTSYISQTIIDGNSNGRVVTFENGEDSTAILAGFTITNGEGGIFLDNSSSAMSHLVITSNSAGNNFGGGIFCNNSTLTLNNANISNNSAHSGGGIEGIHSNILLNNITIDNNAVFDDGGGISTVMQSYVSLNNLKITNNIASSEGGGIELIESTFTLANVTIANNSAQAGGGIFSRHSNNLNFNTVNRCNIYLNSADVGNDLYNGDDDTIAVVIDTFTVLNPTNYHAFPIEKFTFDIQNVKGGPVYSERVINVPADAPTIQAGIDSAADGDTVLVHPGTYVENINFKGKNIAVGSLALTTGDTSYIRQTIIDGSQPNNPDSGSVVYFISGEDSMSVLNGFKITKGTGTIIWAWGNTTQTHGGGIFLDKSSSPVLTNLIVSGNTAPSANGAGICCLSNCNPKIENVTVIGNDGSGSADTNDGSGGILLADSSPILKNVSIVNNIGIMAGGLYCNGNCNPILINVTIAGNNVSGSSWWNEVAELVCWGSCNPVLINTIIWSDPLPEILLRDNGGITIAYSDVQYGLDSIITSTGGPAYWLDGNINADPMFVDAANGDYRLRAGSPCIDAGIQDTIIISNNGLLTVPPMNFIGAAPDMGAYESPFISVTQNFTKITTGDIVNDGGNSEGCSWIDYDNDGDLDLFVSNRHGQNNFFYENNGGGTFTKITSGVIVNDGGNSIGNSWGDYDNDGDLDLFVCGLYENNLLYQNNGDKIFTKITTGDIVNDGGHTHSSSWGDYDNDGDLDLFVTNGGYENNFLYSNDSDGSFTKITTGDIVNDGGWSHNCNWGDYDKDGDLDLFVANAEGFPNNFLYSNNGDGSFIKITTGEIVNDGGFSHSCSWGDYDNDGDLDLFVANAINENNFLYSNNGDGSFTKITTGVIVNEGGSSEACSWGDYDNDGDLDLFVSNGGSEVNENNFLYANDGNTNSWLNVKCIGTISNHCAIGTKVKTKSTINGKIVRQIQEIPGKTGYASQNSLNAEFGLGDATLIDSIIIEWPSGIVQITTNVNVNQFLTIVEDSTLLGNAPWQNQTFIIPDKTRTSTIKKE
jgi:hypothetical protein